MLLERSKSCLLLIDVQEKLMPLVINSEAVLQRCEWLIRLAKDLNVPLLVSEQYPQGLGTTVKPLRSLISEGKFIEKMDFSCNKSPNFQNHLQSLKKQQMVLIGIETHVCVLQTAFDLLQAQYEVFIVVDAVSSRFELDFNYALKRMKQNGIHLITSEMVFFEWIGQSGTPEFKTLSKKYLQKKEY
ncbi:MAG: hydrolase [Tatlockia sp.]|nr:hydrolase [Tatlockia sp.]